MKSAIAKLIQSGAKKPNPKIGTSTLAHETSLESSKKIKWESKAKEKKMIVSTRPPMSDDNKGALHH